MPRRRRPLNVLVVDDSAVMRQLLSALLTQESGVTVTTAADPLIALRKMERFRPDVMVLDIEMPRMDGLTFLRKIMAESPLPVVICSSHAQRGTGAAVEALAQGAVEVIGKPMLGLKDFLEDSSLTLLDTLRAAAEARVPRRPPPPRPSRRRDVAPRRARERGSPHRPTDRVVAVGASTGGPQALQHLLEAMPPDAPGIVIVQHMPEGFTGAFARRLDQICRVEVKEARDGDAVVRGRALIAPGNRHLRIVRRGASFAVHVADGPLVSRHRPSVDVLFGSVARAAGRNAVGAILTGMGDDGAQGLGQMKQSGAVTIAQDAASSVVFGMPKAAIERVGVDLILPLAKIPEAILAGTGPTDSVAPRTVPNSTTRTRPGKS